MFVYLWLSDFPETHAHILSHIYSSLEIQKVHWSTHRELLVDYSAKSIHKVLTWLFFKELKRLPVTYCKITLSRADISQTLFVLINCWYCRGLVPVSVMLELSRNLQQASYLCLIRWRDKLRFEYLRLLYTDPPVHSLHTNWQHSRELLFLWRSTALLMNNKEELFGSLKLIRLIWHFFGHQTPPRACRRVAERVTVLLNTHVLHP